MPRRRPTKGFHSFRWLLPLLFFPYFTLAIGAEGLHRYACNCHCNNLLALQYQNNPSASSELTLSRASLPELSDKSHDADSCILCQWVKNFHQSLLTNEVSIIFTSCEVGDNFLKSPSKILSLAEKYSRAPPL